MLEIKFKNLNVISAGAGSGKTYTVQQTLSNWLEAYPDKIRPDKILAVTFTKMAASEMQSRIRAALLSSGNIDAAKKVTSSQISTIHSFGQKIIQSFAYESGMSPKVRQLSEAEEKILLQLSLSGHREINSILQKLEAFGYKGKYNGSEYSTALDQLQSRVLGLINSLRTIGATEDKANQYIAQLSKEIQLIYGRPLEASTLNSDLHNAVKNMLSSYPDNIKDVFGGNATADKALTANYKALKKALDLNNIAKDWDLWKSLQTLRLTSIKDNNYTLLAQAVMDVANKLYLHPGPLDEAISHIKILLQISIDTLHNYNEAKRENALIDFSDMVHLANSIMDDGAWLKEMAETYDCLVIDEFQDTNPIQFALLWKFKQTGLKTLIVGDLKQSIMGFQGADASLFESLIGNENAANHQLKHNWRSTPKLMKFINAMGTNLYGDKYTSLTPMANYDSSITPIQIIDFDDDNWSANGTNSGKKSFTQNQSAVISEHIKNLISSKTIIYDKNTKQKRAIQASDIAILGQSHIALGKMASSLRESGLEAQIKQDGWFSSRIVQIGFYALSYLANPLDKHAALYMIITELGDVTLQDALDMYLRDKKFSHPLIETLDNLREQITTLTLSRQLITMIEALDLWNYVMEHVDSSQQRANLLKLIYVCSEFESLQFESLNALGIYGRNINSFLTWLSMSDNDAQPQPKSINTQAVQLLTWHASKGLEWPVVVVLGLDSDKAPRLPNISLGYTDESRNDPLKNTYIKFFTEFNDDNTQEAFIANLEQSAHSTIENLLYVVMTRAREQLILPWPSFKEGKVEKFSFMHKLITKCKMKVGASGITMNGLTEGSFEASVVPAIMSDASNDKPNQVPINYGRVAIKQLAETVKISAQISPSNVQEESLLDKYDISIKKYGSKVDLSKIKISASDLGTLLHHCYHALLVDKDMQERLFSSLATKLSSDVLEEVKTQVSEFENYTKDEFSMKNIKCEVPILSKTEEGSVVSGSIDLLIETEHGYWIIDHKSDRVDEDGFLSQFIHHYPQLMSYVKFTKLDKPILGIGINWIRYGMISATKIIK
jgi:ATP-dependent helicase/nuclease subunit A